MQGRGNVIHCSVYTTCLLLDAVVLIRLYSVVVLIWVFDGVNCRELPLVYLPFFFWIFGIMWICCGKVL